MCKRYAAILALFFLSAGCATVPEPPGEDQIRVSDVIHRVRCELHTALRRNVDEKANKNTWLLTWAVVFKLGLKVSEKGDGSAEGTFVVPIPQGKFILGLTGGVAETATSDSTFTFYARLGELKDFDCSPASERSNRNLSGDTGLTEWIDRVVAAINASDVDPRLASGKATARIGYKIDFILKAGASASPGFNIVRTTTHELGGGMRLAVDRERTHSLEIGLTPIPAEPRQYLKELKAGRAPPLDNETIRRLDGILLDLQLRNLNIR